MTSWPVTASGLQSHPSLALVSKLAAARMASKLHPIFRMDATQLHYFMSGCVKMSDASICGKKICTKGGMKTLQCKDALWCYIRSQSRITFICRSNDMNGIQNKSKSHFKWLTCSCFLEVDASSCLSACINFSHACSLFVCLTGVWGTTISFTAKS